MDFPRNLFIEQAKEAGHSEAFLKDTLNYIDVLAEKELPVIFSLNHLGLLMGTDIAVLNSLVRSRNHFYTYYAISKKSGGLRRIIAPFPELKKAQGWIKANIIDKINLHANATGFVKTKSIFNNAKKHEGSEVILNLDLKNFFESISEKRVFGVFKSLGYHPNVAVDLARLCTVKILRGKIPDDKEKLFDELLENSDPCLPQGAPSSPGISNLICRSIDRRFSKLANSLGCNYSRYADDITFSGSMTSLPKLSLLRKIIKSEGFEINYKKGGVYKRGQRQLVTGLLVDGAVRVVKSYKKDIYRHLFFCKKYGASSHFRKLDRGKSFGKEWLLGRIFFVHSIEPLEAAKMMQIVNEIEWEI